MVGLRTYAASPEMAVLIQRFPDGLEPEAPGGGAKNEIASAFPSFTGPEQDVLADLVYREPSIC